MRTSKVVVFGLLTILLVVGLDRKWGSVPPLGRFLDPYAGCWQNAEPIGSAPTALELSFDALTGPVSVLYDSLGVPHIFAQNAHDLYYAQGYVTARDRFWQMEFQTRATAGRLSEVIGPSLLEYDRFQRRFGMVAAAQATLDTMLAHPDTRQALLAYADGVNAYRDELTPAQYPLEYKLLDYAPPRWEPLQTALLLKSMAYTLSGYSRDLQLTRVLQQYGVGVADSLFPYYPSRAEPIIPAGTPWEFDPLPRPDPPQDFPARAAELELPPMPERDLGSNNWAVAGERTATGYPMLASDPHLTMSLPSLWYQVQLHAPDHNVYGVSLPGAPMVIIGFNEDIAWGITNVGADVLDFYEITFTDSTRQAYFYSDEIRAVRRTVDTIRVRGQADVLDTVLHTHHGPITYARKTDKAFSPEVASGYAVRWQGHAGSNEALTFVQLNRARDYDAYVAALRHFTCPAQNFVFAARNGDIALWANGRFPLKWRGQGRYLLDGRDPAHEWQGWVPHAHNPHVRNPARGFVSSANQLSADSTYPYYLDWDFADYNRGARINARLAQMTSVTADSLRQLQNDNYNFYAEYNLPQLLAALPNNLAAPQQAARDTLRAWDFHYTAEALAPTLYEAWWRHLKLRMWHQLPGTYAPSSDVLSDLLRQPDARWFDLDSTEQVETAPDLIRIAFAAALDSLTQKYGPVSPDWQWGRAKGTEIRHVARVPGLGEQLITSGNGGIVNATGKYAGPSWRMVVEVGPQMRGYGIYPGGQSGNPGSPRYDNLLETWRRGQLLPLVYLTPADTAGFRRPPSNP